MNLVINVDALSGIQKNVVQQVRASFKKHYPGGDIDTGKNLLIVKVAESFVNNLIDYEKRLSKSAEGKNDLITIIGLEETMNAEFEFQIANNRRKINLKGVVDRIDSFDNRYRIIDYKTGKVIPGDLKLKNWDDLLSEKKMDKVFQLLFYYFLYDKTAKFEDKIWNPGVISFKNLGAGFLSLQLPDTNHTDEIKSNFENILQKLFEDIFDPAMQFTQTEELKNCEYCNFKSICNR